MTVTGTVSQTVRLTVRYSVLYVTPHEAAAYVWGAPAGAQHGAQGGGQHFFRPPNAESVATARHRTAVHPTTHRLIWLILCWATWELGNLGMLGYLFETLPRQDGK